MAHDGVNLQILSLCLKLSECAETRFQHVLALLPRTHHLQPKWIHQPCFCYAKPPTDIMNNFTLNNSTIDYVWVWVCACVNSKPQFQAIYDFSVCLNETLSMHSTRISYL